MKKKQKNKFNIALKNGFKNKRVIIISTVLILSILGAVIYTVAKYVITLTDTHIQPVNAFYFNSNLLKLSNPEYTINDWDTASTYVITIDLKNYEDSLRKTNYNIPYTVIATSTSSKVNVVVNPNSGTLITSESEDTISVSVSLNQGQTLQDNEQIPVQVTAVSTSPYAKEIKAIFKLSKSGVRAYCANLVDSTNSSYATLSIKVNDNSITKTITYDSTKMVLNTAENVLSNISVSTNGNNKSASVNLLANTNYTIEFIKKSPSNTLILGEDITIN